MRRGPGRPKKSAQEKILELLQKNGVETKNFGVNTPEDLNYLQEVQEWRGVSAVNFLAKWYKVAIVKKCEHCEEVFATNYKSVAYCSPSCTAKAFMDMTKMPWSFTKEAYTRPLAERWQGYEPPQVVDPDLIKTLEFLYLKLKEIHQDQKVEEEYVELVLQNEQTKDEEAHTNPHPLPAAQVPDDLEVFFSDFDL